MVLFVDILGCEAALFARNSIDGAGEEPQAPTQQTDCTSCLLDVSTAVPSGDPRKIPNYLHRHLSCPLHRQQEFREDQRSIQHREARYKEQKGRGEASLRLLHKREKAFVGLTD